MRKYIIFLLSLALFVSCYKDEGNYKYAKMNFPEWFEGKVQPKFFSANAGETIVLDGSKMYKWMSDSLKRASEVNYEWVLNNKVVGNSLVVKIKTEDLMKKAGIDGYSAGVGTYGTFSIVEKNSGVKYMAKILVRFYPKYSSDDWIILGENRGKAEIYAIKTMRATPTYTYKYLGKVYKEGEENPIIEGKPIRMNWAADKQVSSGGSITVITDKGSYIFKADDLTYFGDFNSQEFLDGRPADFHVVARADVGGTSTSKPATFLISDKGKIYTRLMSKNYLGGKFLTEPYYLDEKGYKVSKFGNTLYQNLIPCYDELNRRLIVASVVSKQEGSRPEDKFISNAIRLKALSGECIGAPFENYPVGTEMLYIGTTAYNPRASIFVAVYNTPEYPNNTVVGDFEVNISALIGKNEYFLNRFMLQDKLDGASVILSSGNTRNRRSNIAKILLYSLGTTVKYVERNPWAAFGGNYKDVKTKIMNLPEVRSKITFMSFDYSFSSYLVIGCENGDILIYNVNAPNLPQLVFQTNIGCKVLSFKQLGTRRPFYQDSFND